MKKYKFIPYNSWLTEYAKTNRKWATRQEWIIWNMILKDKKFHEYKFRRQKVIGSFILDFYCPKLLLWIEIDGGYHNERQDYDKARDFEIYKKWIKILRFTNNEIDKNLEWVVCFLEDEIKRREKWIEKLME